MGFRIAVSKIIFLLPFMVSMFLSGCQGKAVVPHAFQKMNIPPLSFEKEGGDVSTIQEYVDFYGLDFPEASHYFGFFDYSNLKIFANGFILPQPKGTVLILHGYFDHSGTMTKLIQACIHAGFSVVTLDLPGHGLSSGKRGYISDFSIYGAMLEAFVEANGKFFARPFHMVGFSTGGGIIFDFIRQKDRGSVDKIVLLSPLVRTNRWSLVSFLVPVANVFLEYLPRNYSESSSDESFLQFLKDDPLELNVAAVGWLDSLMDWNEQLLDLNNGPLVSKEVLMIQGTKDEVVDWEYNLPFLEKRIDGLQVEKIDGARHHLANEALPIRQEVFGKVIDFMLK